jgi:hypothetical protein
MMPHAAALTPQPWLPSVNAAGSVLYPEGATDSGSRWVQWATKEPYARQHDWNLSAAAPYVPQLACKCGVANPDGCVSARGAATAPFVAWHPSSASVTQWQFKTPYELPP